MALSRISSFNWEKLAANVRNVDGVKAINLLRGKANEITSNAGKYAAAPAPIDFKSYEKKLKFTGAAVKTLEIAYTSAKLPVYTATLSAFDSKKRALMLDVAKSTASAAKADLENLKAQLEFFEKTRITKSTSVGELKMRFPHIAKEIESEIKNHEWAKDTL